MTRIKYFEDYTGEDLQKKINRWLNKENKFITLIDIKYSMASYREGYLTHAAMIIYSKKI